MTLEQIKIIKTDIRNGFMYYLQEIFPDKAISTIKTYISDSLYLLNNGEEGIYFEFMRNNLECEEVKNVIRKILTEKRGEEKAKQGVCYYFHMLELQKKFLDEHGGIDIFALNINV